MKETIQQGLVKRNTLEELKGKLAFWLLVESTVSKFLWQDAKRKIGVEVQIAENNYYCRRDNEERAKTRSQVDEQFPWNFVKA
jgi:hypothetical protein